MIATAELYLEKIKKCWNDVQFQFGCRPEHSFNETTLFFPILAAIRPKTIIEIGVHYGGSLRFWIEAADDNALIIGVDNHHDVIKRSDRFRKWLRGNQKFEIVYGDSNDINTFNKVKGVLGDRNVDFLFIDGCHDMPYPKIDYEFYSPLVKNGIIALHDIGGGEFKSTYEYWFNLKQEITAKTDWKIIEFYSNSYNPKSERAGIGVILNESLSKTMADARSYHLREGE